MLALRHNVVPKLMETANRCQTIGEARQTRDVCFALGGSGITGGKLRDLRGIFALFSKATCLFSELHATASSKLQRLAARPHALPRLAPTLLAWAGRGEPPAPIRRGVTSNAPRRAPQELEPGATGRGGDLAELQAEDTAFEARRGGGRPCAARLPRCTHPVLPERDKPSGPSPRDHAAGR